MKKLEERERKEKEKMSQYETRYALSQRSLSSIELKSIFMTFLLLKSKASRR